MAEHINGPLNYERYCSTICGDEWRARAEKALELLRSQNRATCAAPEPTLLD